MHAQRLLALGSVAVLCAVLASLLAPSTSFAHERRTIGAGQYDVVVGWDTEPAYVNEKNAASIRISKSGTNPAEPITGAEKTLKVEIRQGAQTRSFDLRAAFGQPGYYLADLVPTRDGDYVLSFVGSIGGDQINEKFDTADGKFNAVQPATDVQFPIAAPEPAQIVAELQGTRAAAQTAQTIGLVGVGVGVLGLLAALGLWLSRPRRVGSLGIGSRRQVGERFS
ncbi:MAG TPA: hypothetical protein VKV73_30075 [Chloroflexota bacterium]|nr:hypothetical protein [Chloroflexota bacterium]